MHLDTDALASLARGCAVLGSGGGGPAAPMIPLVEAALGECGPVALVHPADLPADALVMPVGMVGSSAVGAERIGGRAEPARLRDRVEQQRGGPVAAVMASEIGGQNGCLALAFAARCGLPLLDADSMGRAYPLMHQNVLELAGIRPGPTLVADERGRTVVVDHVDGPHLEHLVRAAVDALGGRAVCSDYPLTAGQAADSAVLGTVSLALRLGAGELPEPLLTGKVTAVQRHGAAAVSVLVDGLGPDSGRLLRVEARSEFVAAVAEGRALALVPDVIALLDARTGEAVDVEDVRYGLRVRVLALPAPPIWYTPAGLALGGPEAFGLSGLVREEVRA
ncbi:DUF917 domain-containing protein [Streptomyces sp. NPDC002520]